MVALYPIYHEKQLIGEAQVSQKGLYYNIHCRCWFHEFTPYHVVASGKEGTADLGICVPVSSAFELNKSVAIKKLGTDGLTFNIAPRRECTEEQLLRVLEDQPFPYLDALQNGYMINREGVIGILIKDRYQVQPGNDQNP